MCLEAFYLGNNYGPEREWGVKDPFASFCFTSGNVILLWTSLIMHSPIGVCLDSRQKFTYIIITRAITILLKIVGFVIFDKIMVIYRDSVKFYCQFKYILDQ
jgi:hypothetical protein